MSLGLSVAKILSDTNGDKNKMLQGFLAGKPGYDLTAVTMAAQKANTVAMNAAQPPQGTVASDALGVSPQALEAAGGIGGLVPPQQAAPQMGMMPPQGAPQMPPAPPQGMAEGGLAELDFYSTDYADGGVVGYAMGDLTGLPSYQAYQDFQPAQFEGTVSDYLPEVQAAMPRQTAARDELMGLLSQFDPEAQRKRLGTLSILQGLGAAVGGTPPANPMEAFVRGLTGAAGAMVAGEDKLAEKELRYATARMGIEDKDNEYSGKLYEAANLLRKEASDRLTRDEELRLRRLETQFTSEVQVLRDEMNQQAAMARTLVTERGANYRARIAADAQDSTLSAARLDSRVKAIQDRLYGSDGEGGLAAQLREAMNPRRGRNPDYVRATRLINQIGVERDRYNSLVGQDTTGYYSALPKVHEWQDAEGIGNIVRQYGAYMYANPDVREQVRRQAGPPPRRTNANAGGSGSGGTGEFIVLGPES